MLNKLQELPSKVIIYLFKVLQKGAILIPIVTLVVILALYLFIRLKTITSWAVDAGGIEQNVMYSLLRLCNGYPLYTPTHQPPFSVTQYAPFYYQGIGWIHDLIAPEKATLYFYYCLNRSFGLMGNLFMAFGVYYIVTNQLQVKKPYPFWIAAICLIVLPPHTYCRPDAWYLTFFVFSVMFFLRYIRLENTRDLFLSAFFAILSFYTKQTAIGLLIWQSALILLYSRSIRHIIYYYLTGLGTLILFYFILNIPSIEIYLENTVGGINNGISLDNFKNNIIDHFHKPFLMVDIIGIGTALFLIVRNVKPFSYLGYLTLGMFLFATGTALKNGSALNYYIEFIILSALCVISFQNPAVTEKEETTIPSWLSYFLLVGISINLLINAPNFNWIRAFGGDVSKQLYIRDQSIADFLYRDGLKKGQQLYTPEQFSFLNLILFEYCLFPQHDIHIEMNGLNYDKILNFDPSNVRYILLHKEMKDIPFLGLKLSDYREITVINDIKVFRLKRD